MSQDAICTVDTKKKKILWAENRKMLRKSWEHMSELNLWNKF